MGYEPGDVANGHVLGQDLVWRPLDTTLQPGATSSPEPARMYVAWAALSGLAFYLLAYVFLPYPDGDAAFRAGYFSTSTVMGVAAAVLLVRRLKNPWRVLLALALPPLFAGMFWFLSIASRLAS